MLRIWFTADTHFRHARIIEFCARPHKDIMAHDEALIANWNAVVAQGDRVYHLGDFAMGDRSAVPDIRARLNGEIWLCPGNHDHKRSYGVFDGLIKPGGVIDLDGVLIEVVHAPTQARTKVPLVFCGHVHKGFVQTMTQDGRRLFNVGVDVRGYKPVGLAEVLGG